MRRRFLYYSWIGGMGIIFASCSPTENGGYVSLKQEIASQATTISDLKRASLATEGPNGYLIGSDKLDLPQRELIQRENLLREKIFALIGQRTGQTREQVAGIFAELARGSTAVPRNNRAD